MHLQPKSVDTSQNVLDIHKARNANELITVVARINTALRLHQHNYNSMEGSDKTALNTVCMLLTNILQIQQELQAAFSVTNALTDAKRDRCVTAITNLNAETLDLKRRIMSHINRESERTVSETLDKYVNVVHDFFRPLASKIYTMTIYDGNTSYVAIIAKQVQLSSGFISPEVCVKVAECVDGFKVCLPASTFVNADWTWFSTSKQLRTFITTALDYSVKAAPVKASKVPMLEGVIGVDVTDTLNVHFDSAAKASEINSLLKTVVPLVKKAVGASSYEVLHRVVTAPNGRTLQLCIGSKKVVDTASLNRLYRALKLQRPIAAAANSLMELK